MWTQLALLLSTLQLVAEVTSTPSPAPYYQLIYQITNTATEDGSVTLTCRNATTAEELNVQNVKFWLNRSAEYERDLSERGDIGTVEVIGCCTIKFSLQQRHEGYYTCGTSSEEYGVHESPQLTLISPQKIAPDRANVRTNFTAISGGNAILDCPNKPGALRQYYSVRWMKNSITIARFSASEGFSSNNPRYRIDRSTFALIISSVDMTDSGEGYQCDVYIRNPSGANNDQLPSNNGSITLDIYGKGRISPSKFVVTKDEDQTSFNCTVEYTGTTLPNITWSNVNKGVEKNIACEDPNYKITRSLPRRENGRFILCSTLTVLNLNMVKNQDVVVLRCRSDSALAESDAYLVNTCRSGPSADKSVDDLVKTTAASPMDPSPEMASMVDMRVNTIYYLVLAVGLAVTTSVLSVSWLVLILLIGGYSCSKYCHGLKKPGDTPSLA